MTPTARRRMTFALIGFLEAHLDALGESAVELRDALDRAKREPETFSEDELAHSVEVALGLAERYAAAAPDEARLRGAVLLATLRFAEHRRVAPATAARVATTAARRAKARRLREAGFSVPKIAQRMATAEGRTVPFPERTVERWLAGAEKP